MILELTAHLGARHIAERPIEQHGAETAATSERDALGARRRKRRLEPLWWQVRGEDTTRAIGPADHQSRSHRRSAVVKASGQRVTLARRRSDMRSEAPRS